MHLLWIAPLAVAGLGAAAVATAAARAAHEGRRLRGELNRLGQLRPALVELRSEVSVARQRAEQLLRRD